MAIMRKRALRFPPRGQETVAAYIGETRLEGYLCDESPTGIGVVFPAEAQFTPKQRLRVVHRKNCYTAQVVHTRELPEGTRVGLSLKPR